MTAPDPCAVRDHYARLAIDYDRRANKACKRAYAALVREKLAGARRVLEVGAGSEPLARVLEAPMAVACDLSLPMLRRSSERARVVADGSRLPFCTASFDAVFAVNVLEHVPDPGGFAAACARVLAPGGRLLAITPNGDAAWLLEVLERMRLKLPEGPHRFLGRDDLLALAGQQFRVEEHRRFLACPAGTPGFVGWVDRLCGRTRKDGWGLFHYVLMIRE